MVQYLSDEWMAEAGAALAESPALAGIESDAAVLLQYEVAGGPDGKRSYGVRFQGGAVSLEPGAHKDASTSFTVDYDVAAEIARGDLSAQAAFMQGRLKLGGDVMVLVRQHALMTGLDDALADLRGRTEY